MVSASSAAQLGAQDEDRAPLAVSLVIPIRDEAASLGALIKSINRQTVQPAEVLLVDGGSTDGTPALARRLTTGDERFRVVEAGPATPGRGRNVGIAAARNQWVALTDAGISLEPTWLEHLLAALHEQPDASVVYGNYEPVTDTFFTRCAALAYVSPKWLSAAGLLRAPFIASSLIRRDVWQHVGGFPDLRAAEDLIFMERIAARGYEIAYAPQATIWWQLRPTLGSTFRRFVSYSRHNVWAGRQHAWHYGLARQYAIAAVFISLALLHSRWWLVVPLLGLLARTAKSIWRHRAGRGMLWALHPLQFVYVLLIILTIDLATFIGWAQAVWRAPVREANARSNPEQTKS
jgi:glycosyltransferase involved in cell wall biosynthesis